MDLVLQGTGDQPLYRQIVEQLRDQILSGALAAQTPLPSIRNLAKDLRISVITTKRAYDELEALGLIYTMAGKGCFVAELSPALFREEHLRQIQEHLRAIRQLALRAGLSPEELRALYRTICEEENK